MEVNIRKEDGVHVVSFVGNLDTGTSPQAEEQLLGLIDAGGQSVIVVDLTHTEYISSAGLRVFLATSKKLKTANGKIGLFGLNETVQEVFEISGFVSILRVFATLEQALAELR